MALNPVEQVILGYNDETVYMSDFTYSGKANVNDAFFKAAASYNNAINNLNKKAKKYLDEKGIGKDARQYGTNTLLNLNSKFDEDTSKTYNPSDYWFKTYKWSGKFKCSYDYEDEDQSQCIALGFEEPSSNWWSAKRYISGDSKSSQFSIYKRVTFRSANIKSICTVKSDGSCYGRK